MANSLPVSRPPAPAPHLGGQRRSLVSYLGPYYFVRRTSNGEIDTTFGANGYVSAFNTSADQSYKFTSLCVDPGTDNLVVVGKETNTGGTVGVVERLIPPASGSGNATLDTSFNPSGTTPGIVTVATPNGNNSPTLYGCSVVDEGAGHSGAILVGGVDDAASSSLVLAAKISSSGGYDTIFGSNGVVEYHVQSVNGSGTSAEITNVSLSGDHSDFPGRDPFRVFVHQGHQSGFVGAGVGDNGGSEGSHRRSGHQLQRHRRTDQPQLRRGGIGPRQQYRRRQEWRHRY
jgi:hypothetical protein